MTTIYHYHEQTREFLGVSVADRCQITGVDLLPWCATAVAPPKIKAHQAAIFADTGWQVVADWRGTHYWLPDGSEHVIGKLNETLPVDAQMQPPPENADAVVPVDTTTVTD